MTITVGRRRSWRSQPNPSALPAGVTFTTQPVVTVQDAGGNTGDASNVTNVPLTITPGSADVRLHHQPEGRGRRCRDLRGLPHQHGRHLHADRDRSRTGAAVSSSFTITVGAATKLAFTTQPGGAVTGGTAFAAAGGERAGRVGNTVHGDTSTVLLTLTTPGGATLACTPTPRRGRGRSSNVRGLQRRHRRFVHVDGDRWLVDHGGQRQLTISVGAAAKLAFTTQPSRRDRGTALRTQPAVSVQDAAGNTVTASTSNVVLTIPAGSTLTCTTATRGAAVAGVATFAGCNINLAGNYTAHGDRRA